MAHPAAAWVAWAAWTSKSSTERHNVKSRKPRRILRGFFYVFELVAFFEREVLLWHCNVQRLRLWRYDALDDNYSTFNRWHLIAVQSGSASKTCGTREITPDLQILEIKL